MTKLMLLVTVDQNDADYNTAVHEVSPEQLERLRPVFEAIKNFQPYKGNSGSGLEWTHKSNWPMGEYQPREDLGEKFPVDIYAGVLTEAQIEEFEGFCPYGEHGFHSVDRVTVLHVTEEEVYLGG